MADLILNVFSFVNLGVLHSRNYKIIGLQKIINLYIFELIILFVVFAKIFDQVILLNIS